MKYFEVIIINVVLDINLFTSPIIANMLIVVYDLYPYTNYLINPMLEMF